MSTGYWGDFSRWRGWANFQLVGWDSYPPAGEILKQCNFSVLCQHAILTVVCLENWYTSDIYSITIIGMLQTSSTNYIVCRGVQSLTWKKIVSPKQPIPTWNETLLKSQQNFQTCLKSNFLFTPISNIYTSKGFQDHWSQVNKFINSHFFTHYQRVVWA